MTLQTRAVRNLIRVLLGLRTIMLVGSVGAIFGSLLMFLQGAYYLVEATQILMSPGAISSNPVTVPVLEAIDSFLFGVVLVIFAYGIAIGFVLPLPPGMGRRLPKWMKIQGVGQLKEILAQAVMVVLIVIFARIVVQSGATFQWNMLVLPLSVLLIAIALRMIGLRKIDQPDEHEETDL